VTSSGYRDLIGRCLEGNPVVSDHVLKDQSIIASATAQPIVTMITRTVARSSMEKYVQMVTWVNGELVSWDPEWEDVSSEWFYLAFKN
jgi:hypothetical protein